MRAAQHGGVQHAGQTLGLALERGWLANLDDLSQEVGLEELPTAIERILAGGQVGRVLVRVD